MYRLINRNDSAETRRANNKYEVQYQRRTTTASKRRRGTTKHGVIKKVMEELSRIYEPIYLLKGEVRTTRSILTLPPERKREELDII